MTESQYVSAVISLRFIRGISNEPEQQLLISLSYGELLALFERRTELCPGSMK